MEKSLMQFLHPNRKPNVTFKLDSFGDAEFEMRALNAEEMGQMSAEVQTKGLKGLEALYPTIALSLVSPNLSSAELLDALSEKEGRRILSPTDALKTMFTAGEIGALLNIYNEHSDVTIDFGKKVDEAKN